MANPLARLFSGSKIGKIEDFSGFLSTLVQHWNPAFTFASIEAGDGAPRADGEARLLFAQSDRPAAVVVGPPEDASSLDSLASLVRAAVGLLSGGEGVSRIVAMPAAAVVPEYRDYRVFSSEATGWLILFEGGAEESFRNLLASLGPKDLGAAAAAAFSPEAVASAAPLSLQDDRVFISEPWAACASRLLFPSAVQAGEISIRFRPRSFRVGEPGEVTEGEVWYKFGIKTETASFGGLWAFKRPSSIPPERFPALASSLAKAAGAALAAEYAALHLGGRAATAAEVAAAPKFGATAVFTLEGTVSVAAALIELRIIVPTAYPLRLASLCGRSETDAASAILAVDRMLALRLDEGAIDGRAQLYRSDPVGGAVAAEGVRFVPFYELLGVFSEDDYRKTAQNFLIRRYHREEFAELLFYRKTVVVEGSPKRVVVRPQAFDLNRFIAVLPAAVRDSFIAAVREGASSATADDFILLNESLYEGAMADIRRGALELGYYARELLGNAYARYVYPRKRKRLDAMIEKDYPFALLRAAPQRLFRAVVDGSDFKMIAASLVGKESEFAEIEKWCSRRKRENILEENRRITALLKKGEIDADELCSLRSAMADKLAAVRERENKDREAANARERASSFREKDEAVETGRRDARGGTYR